MVNAPPPSVDPNRLPPVAESHHLIMLLVKMPVSVELPPQVTEFGDTVIVGEEMLPVRLTVTEVLLLTQDELVQEIITIPCPVFPCVPEKFD